MSSTGLSMFLRWLCVMCLVTGSLTPIKASAIGAVRAGRQQRRIEDSIKSDISALSSEEFSSSSVESMEDSVLTLEDQVRLLSKQMSALMTRRREDYKMLEESLKSTVRKSAQQFGQAELHEEVLKLRQEVKTLRRDAAATAKDRLTVDWFTQTVGELRAEIAELQQSAKNTSRAVQQRSPVHEEVSELQYEQRQMHLGMDAFRSRQETLQAEVKELRAELLQSGEVVRTRLHRLSQHLHAGGDKHTEIDEEAAGHFAEPADDSADTDAIQPEADHRMRHRRFMRQQMHEIDVAQHQMRHQLGELQRDHLASRMQAVEQEQRSLADKAFNVSRQVASLDRLHGSMLALLEDIESVQAKVDKNVPEIRREISKVEFSAAQLAAEQNILREEAHNAAKSIQAIAVSVSTLQDERDQTRQLRSKVEHIQQEVADVKLASSIHKDIAHRRLEKMESASRSNTTAQTAAELQVATELVDQLESVELQYESIVNKLPQDCSQLEHTGDGLYLIAPVGQQRPVMTHCAKHWTTVQRRYDGSVDFNRSWEDYAQGFGSPAGEFWIGNEVLSHLTAVGCHRLRIIMQDIYDNTWLAVYNDFKVNSRADGFRLTVNQFAGNASDALDYQNHMQFSAIDVDRDISNTHCAGNYEGGWWFSHCQHANLNGRYNLGLTWFDAVRNEWIAVKSSHMMVAPRVCASANDEWTNGGGQQQQQLLQSSTAASASQLTATSTATPSAATVMDTSSSSSRSSGSSSSSGDAETARQVNSGQP